MKRLVVIDSDQSTMKAFTLCLKEYKEGDVIYLLSVYSSWDLLNSERNASKMAIGKYQELCHSEEVLFQSVRREVDSPNETLIEFVEEHHVNIVYIGENTYATSHTENNIVFNFFSNIKKFIVGTAAYYLYVHLSEDVELKVLSDSGALVNFDEE